MNSSESKTQISKKLDDLIESVEQILYPSESLSKSDFHFDLTKERLIQLYNLICDYQKQAYKISNIDEIIPVIPQKLEEHDLHVEKTEHNNSEKLQNEPEITEESISNNQEEYPHIPEAFEITDESIDTQVKHKDMEEKEIIQSVFHEEKQDTISVSDSMSESQNQTISDKLKKDTHSIHEKFNTGIEDKSISSRLQSHPVQDLRKAIGINDRFSFISELFDGNKPKFDQFIDELSSLNDSSLIESVLQEIANERNWIVKPSFSRFNDLVRRYALSK